MSALEVERALLELDYVTDAAVVGVPDEEWGQIVGTWSFVPVSCPDHRNLPCPGRSDCGRNPRC